MSLDIRKRRSVALAAGATVAIFAGYGTGAVAEGAVAILAGVLTAVLVSRTTAIGPRHATVARTKAVFGVASDPRYLTTIGGTRGEMIQPVFDEAGAVVGTIDVESDRVTRSVAATGNYWRSAPRSYAGLAAWTTSRCSGPSSSFACYGGAPLLNLRC